MSIVGDKLRELRTARNMTQAELADRLNITKSTVSAYENGARLPSYDVLIRAARLFRTSTDNLLGYTSRDFMDVTGLSAKQRTEIWNIVRTYQRHNVLYQAAMEEDGLRQQLAAQGLLEEGEVPEE